MKLVVFEKIDFNIYNDGDRIVVYMIDKDGVLLWMKCIDEYYRGFVFDIEWSKCDYEVKMMV